MLKTESVTQGLTNRRAFLKTGALAAGVATGGAGLLADVLPAFGLEANHDTLTKGDAAILRFLSAAEIIESDLWLQYNELGGVQDGELPRGGGSNAYINALEQLDADMPQYIHDNTEDEFTHFQFI